jgi:hypothetical protein
MFFKEMIGSFMMGKTFFYFRKSRKIGEKNRRDRLNTLLAQLAEENPWSAYKKGCTRLAAASDKAYQLLAHGRWFSPGTLASSTTTTGRHYRHS